MTETIKRYAALTGLLGAFAWLISSPGWEPAIAVIMLLGTFVAFDRRLSTVPEVSGRWEYVVTRADNRFSHKGDCHIEQAERILRIRGTRRYTCSPREGGGTECNEVAITWGSDWSEICTDDVLRFDYHIPLKDPEHGGANIEAICRLRLEGKRPQSMEGSYFMLPPFNHSTPNCQWGTIVFQRLADDAPITPPSPPELGPV